MTAPTAPREPAPAALDAAIKRRAELGVTIRELTKALEAPAVGREAAWMERVVPRLEALQSDIDEHIERTEADDGLYDEIRLAQPRLSNQVRRLIADHEVLRDRIAACLALATHSSGTPDPSIVKAVRDDATHIVSLLQRHRQRGSDLIFEAYETDIGGDE